MPFNGKVPLYAESDAYDRPCSGPAMSNRPALDGVAVILVEYRSGGLVADRASEALAAGAIVSVADNSGTYVGEGLVTRATTNVGFGAGCNLAVSALPAGADVLIFVNPDVEIDVHGLQVLAEAVRDGWTAVAPGIDTGGGHREQGFAVPSAARAIALAVADVIELHTPWRRRRASNARGVGDDHGRGVLEAEGRFASAAVLAVDRAGFEAVGGFDDSYFLYVEDLDLWARLANRGRVGFVPDVVARHAGSQGSGGMSVDRRMLLRWIGREQFLQRHGGRWRLVRFAHRALVGLLQTDDPMIAAVREALLRNHEPAVVSERARLASQKTTDAGEIDQQIRVGWSRAKLGIKGGDRVLDVGSGAFPCERADVLCERSLRRRHRSAIIDRPMVVADALALPFRDHAFGAVIASHLAEHVDRPDVLCSELERVARTGYVETPSRLFERLFPSSNHLWKVSRAGDAHLRFECVADGGTHWLERLGERLYPYYYAGTTRERPVYEAPLPLKGAVDRLAWLVRGILNRAGLTVTRVRFGDETPLRATVVGSSASDVGAHR